MTEETNVAEKPRAEPWSPPLIYDYDTSKTRVATQADITALVAFKREMGSVLMAAESVAEHASAARAASRASRTDTPE